MSIYSRKLSIPLPWAITAFFLALIAIFVGASMFFTDKPWLGKEGLLWLFAVGAVPGLVVALAQFILSWAEFGEISRLRVDLHWKLTHWGCGRKLGLPRGSSCTRTKTACERSGFI